VPDAASIIRDLERLLGSASPSSAAPAAAPEPSGEPLDFSKPS
jgi:hypothetical protein